MLKKQFRLFKELHHNHNEEFEREYMKENYKRLIPALLTLYVVEWGLFFFEHKLFNVGDIILSYQLVNTVVIIALVLMNQCFEGLPVRLLKVPVFLWALATMFFGVALVFQTQNETDLIHMFMMMTLGVAAFVYMHPLERLALFAIPTLFFFFGFPMYQSDVDIVNVGRVNVIFFTTFMLFLSSNLYFLKYRDFLSKAELVEKNIILDKLSKMDLMTNLYNHKFILDILSENMEQSKRYGCDLSIILIDIDNFKQLNDDFGHIFGDEVINMLADILRINARATDKIGRYGGEEFLVVMPNTSLDGARNYYNRIRTSFQEKTLPNDIFVTISAGVAFYESQDITNFLKDADTNLYKAKHQGKDRCI
jgi:diguanylate cyclase (GGDEF)-like protein